MKSVDASTSPAVRNNGGGYYNHILYWNSMCDGGSAPSGELSKAIDDAFGSMDAVKEELKKAGTTRFGSGFACADRLRRQAPRHVDAEPGQPADAGGRHPGHADPRARRLGARLLP